MSKISNDSDMPKKKLGNSGIQCGFLILCIQIPLQ